MAVKKGKTSKNFKKCEMDFTQSTTVLILEINVFMFKVTH